MPATETQSVALRWRRLRQSVSARLIAVLAAGTMAIVFLLGYLNLRLHRQDLEASTLTSAERVSDVIRRNASQYMLHNDREGLYSMIGTVADEPGMYKVRIFDKEGRIRFSTDHAEVGAEVDKNAEACYACHAQAQPLARLNRPDRFRIYRANGMRVLGVITPIENHVQCSSAPCHAHPADQRILGVLDTNLSLAWADASVAASSKRMIVYTLLALMLMALLIGVFVWRVVGRPVQSLKEGTEKLAQGALGYHIEAISSDELGDLARSFNNMSSQLRAASDEIVAWTHTLEDRVEEKTHELKKAHEHMLHNERLATMGKMAAVLAHEINNPLSGILTYSKLLSKWIGSDESVQKHRAEMHDSLELISAESKRCGELVRNLLTYSRVAPLNLQPTDINQVVNRSIRLIQHKLQMAGVQLNTDLDDSIPLVQGDASQLEQVLLALVLNAIDAMHQGGNLWIASRTEDENVVISVRDDGIGIPPELLPRIFDPFLTTKETGGAGLGLAVSKSIIERHKGSIQAESVPGKGSTFTITLPCSAAESAMPVAARQANAR